MKVMLLAQFLPPVPGGVERHVWSLATALRARGHEVTLLGFAESGRPAHSVESGVRIVRVASLPARLPGLSGRRSRPFALPMPDPVVAAAVRRELAAGGYDVVHAHNWIVNSALRPAAAHGVPIVVTLHDYGQVCPTVSLMYRDRTPCSGPARGKCIGCAASHYGRIRGPVIAEANAVMAPVRARRVAAFAAVSSAVAEAVGLPDVEVIPNFIADDAVDALAAPAAAGAPLVFVGTLSADKGVATLLEAYRAMDTDRPLLLAGPAVAGQTWPLPPGAEWLGELPHAGVLTLMRSAAAVVVPSVWPDPCPTVVLEAMAAGRPVVAAAVGGIPDLVEDGIGGILVPPGDSGALAAALTRVLGDSGAAAEMGAKALKRARSFTASAIVGRVEQLYERAAAGSRA